jgi:hypothetical protein
VSTVAQIRRAASSLPGVVERSDFDLPSFHVGGRAFVTVRRGRAHALLRLPPDDARTVVAADPAVFQEVHHLKRHVGVLVDLAGVDADRLTQLIGCAWRHAAPRHLLGEADAVP